MCFLSTFDKLEVDGHTGVRADVTDNPQGLCARTICLELSIWHFDTIVTHNLNSSIEHQHSFPAINMKATTAFLLVGAAATITATAESSRPRGVGPECMSSSATLAHC